MIIKGNTVGHPLADPRSGLSMKGAINMNGQRITGLNAPVADDEAVNKGYVDGNKVDKSRVVNNLTTTEEGFVADARALKILNDRFNMELLWENASPTSEFAEQHITVNTSKYRFLVISYTFAQEAPVSILVPINHDEWGTHVMLGYDNYWVANNLTQYRSEHRRMIIHPGYIDVRYGIILTHNEQSTTVSKPSVSNSSCIPYRIYGIEGEAA